MNITFLHASEIQPVLRSFYVNRYAAILARFIGVLTFSHKFFCGTHQQTILFFFLFFFFTIVLLLLNVMQVVRVLHVADVVGGIYQPEKNFHSHSATALCAVSFYRTERLIYETGRKL